MGICVALVAVSAAALMAQERRASSAIPPESGAYYQATAGWVPLRSTLIMPMVNGTTKELFGVGHREATVELPGTNAAFRITNVRPTFVVRGFSPATGLYLVRGKQKEEYRELRMPISSHITQWGHFRAKDLTEIEIEPLDNDVVRLRPRTDLKPGEYVIVSDRDPRYRAIRVGFEFAVTGATKGS